MLLWDFKINKILKIPSFKQLSLQMCLLFTIHVLQWLLSICPPQKNFACLVIYSSRTTAGQHPFIPLNTHWSRCNAQTRTLMETMCTTKCQSGNEQKKVGLTNRMGENMTVDVLKNVPPLHKRASKCEFKRQQLDLLQWHQTISRKLLQTKQQAVKTSVNISSRSIF